MKFSPVDGCEQSLGTGKNVLSYMTGSTGTRVGWGKDRAMLPMSWTADITLRIEGILKFFGGR